LHLNRTLLNWGVFFVLLGAIPLVVRQGLLSEDQVARAWTLWPLLLIAAGIGLLLRRTRLEFAGGLLSAATLGIISGGLIASGGIPFASCGDEQGSVAFPARNGSLDRAAVNVELNCGELTIQTTRGSDWAVEGVDDDGSGPRIEATSSSLAITSHERSGFDFLGARQRWTVTLPTGTALGLTATLNAGEARLNLADADLGRLGLDVNAGKATIDLGTVAHVVIFDLRVNAGEAAVNLPNLALRGSIEANAATVRLCPPTGTALRVTLDDNITASNNFAERGLVESSENVWETSGFAAAAVRLEIDADVNAGQATVDLGAVAAIGGFDLQVNAGEAGVNLPNLGLRGSIGANAAAVRLCPPSGAALRVTLDDNITASNNFAERGLIEANEDVWETPGYGAAAIKLEFEADVNAGSIKVEPAGSCGA